MVPTFSIPSKVPIKCANANEKMKYDLLMWKQFATLDVESRIGKISVNMTVIMRSLKTQVIFIFHQIPGKKTS